MSVKKEASGRRSVQVEVEVPAAAGLRWRDDRQKPSCARLSPSSRPAHLRLISAIRRWLLKAPAHRPSGGV